MRCSYYPQSLLRIRGVNREIGSCIWGVDPRVLFIPSCPGVTGLTNVSLLWDFASADLPDLCVFWSCCCWSVLGRFGVVLLGFEKGSSSLQVAFWGCFCSRA
jgi:hypothetical protein